MSYRLENKEGSIFIQGLIKGFRITDNLDNYTQKIGSFMGGAELKLFNGLIGVNLLIGLVSKSISRNDLIESNKHRLSLGLKYYFRN